MQRETLSRRSVLAIATGCTVAGIGATTVSGVLEDGTAAADTAEETLSRESFSIMEGTSRETTVYVTEAPVEGPTVVVAGGMHGNEIAGYEAAGDIADWRIDAGTLVAIPEANAAAVEQRTRSGDDWGDLNRQFPEGSEPETDLARAIWDVLVEYDADVVVDLHESTGIYAGDPVDGVGQAIFHSDGAEDVETARAAAEYVNRTSVDDPELAFEIGPFSGPNTGPNGLLVHKAARDLGAESYLVETLSTDVDLETRVRWHLTITEQLVADDLFPENEPDNGHEPDVDEDAEANDDTPAESESGGTEDTSSVDDENATDDAADDASPIAKITTEPANADESALESGQTVTLDATCSKAREGRLVCYEWDVGGNDQFDERGETLQVTAGNTGRDTVVLRVTDDADRTATASITLSTD